MCSGIDDPSLKKLTRYGDFKKFITKWMQKWVISSDVGKGFGRLHGDVDPEYISEGLVVPILIVVLYILYVRILFVSWALRQRSISARTEGVRPFWLMETTGFRWCAAALRVRRWVGLSGVVFSVMAGL